MRYKNLVLDKIFLLETQIKNLEFNLNRNISNLELHSNVNELKDLLEKIKALINMEDSPY
jgi:hypothetical protein